MKAFLWKTREVISPFQDPVGDCLVINRPLREHQCVTLKDQGLEMVEVEDPFSITDEAYLLIRDDLYFNANALKRFLEKISKTREPGVCAIQSGPFTDLTCFAEEIRTAPDPQTGTPLVLYGLYYCKGPLGSQASLESLPPVLIEAEQKAFPIEPGDIMPTSVEINFTPAYSDALLFHITHWSHLWLLNLLALGEELLRAFTSNKFMLFLRALSAFSVNKHKIASRFVIKGKGCDIHPTAIVQGCVLGDRVKIGPQCIVQGCILGDDVKLSEQSILLGSVFGKGVSTCPRGWSKLCVVYPNASAGRMQALLVGKNTFMASLARFLDVKFKGTIKVWHKGKLVDTGMNFLGGCLGHDAMLGPDIWVAPGREIPNKAMVLKNPADIIYTIPSDIPAGEPLTVSNGKLVPLKLNKNAPEKPEA